MFTNFFPFGINDDPIQIQSVEYSDERLRELRAKHNSTNSFSRYGDKIVISPHTSGVAPLGEFEEFVPSEHPKLIASLLRHLLFTGFREKFPGIIPVGFSPLEFLSRKATHDPISEFIPDSLSQKISFPRLISIHIKTVERGGKPKHGALIGYRNAWQIDIRLDELIELGYPVPGAEVVEFEKIEKLSGVLSPRANFSGVVQKIESDIAQVDTNDGPIKVPTRLLSIRKTPQQVEKLLNLVLEQTDVRRVLSAVRSNRDDRTVPNVILAEIKRVAGQLRQLQFRNGDNFVAFFTGDASQSDQSFKLQETRLVFDQIPGAASTKPLSGLLKYGPFDSSRFNPKKPNVLLLFREQNRGGMTQFFGSLVNGIPDSRYFKQGLIALYQLHGVNHTLASVSGDSPDQYEKSLEEAIKNSSDNFDLVLVECSEDSKNYPPKDNPYLRVKAKAMSLGIAVQSVRDAHVRNTSIHGSSLGPLALQIYAKLGGQAWRLNASHLVDHELVIGLGSALTRSNSWLNPETSRVVGLTTLFSGDGSYVLGENLPAVKYEDYFNQLLKYLERSINEIAAENGWREGDNVRIVFHVFKPLENIEADVVEKLVAKFNKYKIVFAFVTVATRHPWLMYQARGRDVEACERGQNLILDSHSALLQLKSGNQRTNRSHRTPFPVKVSMHEKSTFKDIQYVSQQILDFSYISWLGFFPKDLPVTIYFSNLMADLSRKLDQIDGWNPTVIQTHFRRKKWFL